jgi:DNA replication and repair protein RecF
MLLEWLEAENFRNLQGKLFCGKGLNIISGDNGEGKTNWLEALHLLATTRSFRTVRLQEAINYEEELAWVRGKVGEGEDVHRVLQVTLQGNTKALAFNGKREAVARYLGLLHTVVFNADELDVVRGQPEARRRFLDHGITGIHPPYIQVLSDYQKVLRQKNTLLHTASENGYTLEKTAELLEPWNEQLVTLASRIHRSRTRYVERLQQALEQRLFEKEMVTIRYASSLEGKGDLGDYGALLTERLALRVQAELAAGRSLLGPHRDELEITFDGHDLRAYGSSGQQRSALLILLLAALEVYYAQNQEYPLFLLDDIDAELDYKRIGQLLEYLDGKTQTFVTTSKESFIERFSQNAAVFKVKNGAAGAI